MSEVLAQIVQTYVFPIFLFLIGLILILVGAGSREQQKRLESPEKSSEPQDVATQTKSGSGEREDEAAIQLWPPRISSPSLPRPFKSLFILSGFVLGLIAAALIGLDLLGLVSIRFADVSSAKLITPPSLISLSYMADGWDPRMVDLRTASNRGIPVRADQALQLLDLWVWVPQQAPEYIVQAEVYANDEFIGATASRPLLAGAVQLGDVEVKSFYHGVHSEAWQVQEDWTDMVIVLVTYRGGKVIGTTRTTIHLDPNGTAWFFDPPNVDFASIVYSINDGPQLVMDFRDVAAGLGVEPGDKLELLEIWYDSNASGNIDYTMEIEAYLSSGVFDPDTAKYSGPHVIQIGLHQIADFTPMEWVIPGGKESLVVALTRNDRTVMEHLTVRIGSPGSSGLVRRSEAVLWPFEQVTYVDFESPADLEEWTEFATSTVSQSGEKAFSGKYSLAVTTTGNLPDEGYVQTQWEHPFQGEVIVGQVYWPHQEGVRLAWAQACTWECVSIPLEWEQWNIFVLDLSEMTFEGTPTNEIEFPGIWIQTTVKGANEENPYTFYIDGIQLYPVKP